ncbi:hypothetical protein E3N88_21523 [Mikania micrantha]|uniref:Reverse transcriptase Ty1/copia-type domain-containing protein n=1 Tax=Mikania micrantha TaxID=192012 RepID=A0A5N6NLR0_9ASTR|nr:hypothetical protein E3N88_21523 [Mikania micrantha]
MRRRWTSRFGKSEGLYLPSSAGRYLVASCKAQGTQGGLGSPQDTIPTQQIPFERILLMNEELANYKEAKDDKNWKNAMKEELESIERNGTWSLIAPPKGAVPIGLKWIFKIKNDAKGKITRKRSLCTNQKDVKCQGKNIYVYKLNKALYGLKLAPRTWNAKLYATLQQLGFSRCPQEHAVYKQKRKEGIMIIGVYVDDLIIAGSNAGVITQFKENMKGHFDMSDLGLSNYYLGIEVMQDSAGISLKQTGYAIKVLKDAKMWEANPTKFPMDPGLRLTKEEEAEPVSVQETKRVNRRFWMWVRLTPNLQGRLSHMLTEFYANGRWFVANLKEYTDESQKKNGDNETIKTDELQEEAGGLGMITVERRDATRKKKVRKRPVSLSKKKRPRKKERDWCRKKKEKSSSRKKKEWVSIRKKE